MRGLIVTCLLATAGCANTVYRVEGEPRTPLGAPRSACEREEWLVIAPSRADIAPKGSKVAKKVDGEALYRVGSKDPESVLDHADTLGPDETFETRAALLDPHDTKAAVAMGLGVAALAAIGVGTGFFVSAFETTERPLPGGGVEEENSVNGTRAGIGGGLVGLGFALGIGGLAISPSHGDRTRANAARHLFLSPDDDPKKVSEMVARHNGAIRRRCEARGE